MLHKIQEKMDILHKVQVDILPQKLDLATYTSQDKCIMPSDTT